ncbi:endonuclease/exonuclease/phosphatase family protein [Microbacterium sp.]|uniref:endonuclease/exonuclease/phosphatase family protein n=1 Tax=Microbacterium sp. TaxID=51671 RepID=UPI0027324033|nr:endonuclease/exonuclease/phosphatase family protein [Microbacterium sp.]MDP3950242.1 endonuclease/exonuclease/phosphatase family protein [Microbacterium sp.]
MKVISYNLRKHRAATELAELITAHEPDILCLQECDVEALPDEIAGLKLAHATQGNRLGLALYYRMNTFGLKKMRAFGLKKSLHDRVLKPAHERVLGALLQDIDNGRELIVASFHAAPLTALNSLRRNQIRAALTELESMAPGVPVLMVGDYNYPVFKENLGQTIRDHGYTLTLSDDRTYTRYRVFKGHYDFATSDGFTIDSIQTLPQRSSDHRPILITAAVS